MEKKNLTTKKDYYNKSKKFSPGRNSRLSCSPKSSPSIASLLCKPPDIPVGRSHFPMKLFLQATFPFNARSHHQGLTYQSARNACHRVVPQAARHCRPAKTPLKWRNSSLLHSPDTSPSGQFSGNLRRAYCQKSSSPNNWSCDIPHCSKRGHQLPAECTRVSHLLSAFPSLLPSPPPPRKPHLKHRNLPTRRHHHHCAKLTFQFGQTHRFDVLRDGHPVVEAQQRNVIVKVQKTERPSHSSQHEPGLGPFRVVASVVLAQRHLYHEPHEAETGTNQRGAALSGCAG